ncbi:MAG: AraC family transcriptional regulator [Arenicella sp.]
MVKTYAERINLTCDYIDEHLSESLSIEQLCAVAHFSKTHFKRQFFEFTGITVYKYIQLLRLKRASYQLVFHDTSKIIDIAMEANFDNPESFSRAFKNAFGQTPSQFRKAPRWKPWSERYQFSKRESIKTMNVEITHFKETKVAMLQHRAAPELLNDSVSHFIEWRKNSELSPLATSNTYGIAYDDPETTEAKDFRFDICGSVKADVPTNSQGVITGCIPQGRCAKMRHMGSHDVMGDAVRYLYAQWLPESGEELRDFPCFFHYLNLFPEVAEHELVTDIYLPLV